MLMTNSDTTTLPHACRPYSRAELASDAAVHLAALVLALGAVPVLITLTAIWHKSAPGIVGVSVYGGTLILMLTASYLYNHLPRPEWRDMLLRFDQSAIYLKIAGTYTPFALLAGAGWGLLAVIWTVAIVATIGNFIVRRRPTLVGVAICLAMGWAVLLGGGDLLAVMPTPVIVLMAVGGALYSLGTIFLIFGNMRFHNTIWHGFVVVASTVFFVAVFIQAAQSAP